MKRIAIFCITILLMLVVLAPLGRALQLEPVNTLREVLLVTDAIVTGKIKSITMPSEKHEPAITYEDYQPYYAIVQMQVQKKHYGSTPKVISIAYPLAEVNEFEFLPVEFKQNDTLLVFLEENVDNKSSVYRCIDGYKVVSGKINAFYYPSNAANDKKRVTKFLGEVKQVQKEIANIRLNGKIPTKEQLKAIHNLDNILTLNNGGIVVVAKLVKTTEQFDDYITSQNTSATLELQTEKTLMGVAPDTFTAYCFTGYGFRPGNSYVLFIKKDPQPDGISWIENSWHGKMEYKGGNVILSEYYYSKSSMSLDEFVSLLQACPKYQK